MLRSPTELELRATNRVRSGLLPRGHAVGVSVRHGSGEARCHLCDEPIKRGYAEFEVVVGEAITTRYTVKFHRECCEAWSAAVSDMAQNSEFFGRPPAYFH